MPQASLNATPAPQRCGLPYGAPPVGSVIRGGWAGFAGGRPKVEEIVAYWPALIPKEEITPSVEVLDA